MSNKTNTYNEDNANIEQEVLEKILSGVYNYDTLPSTADNTNLYWQTVLQQANITPEQYKALQAKYVKRNALGILEAVSASLENNLYIPLSRNAVEDVNSFYQVLDTDFIYFNDIFTPDELVLPQEGTFFIRPNQADAHINYGSTYIVYYVTAGKIYQFPNYKTLEVALVERKLTYDSIQIFENEYITALISKFNFIAYSDRTPEWQSSYPSLAVYRPFPAPEYFLETTHDEVYEGQFFFIRFRTRRVPAGRKYKYQITGVDAADIDIPLEGVFITTGNDNVAGSTIRVTSKRDKRFDGNKTMIVNVDVPYDQTYGGGLRLELPIDILERSVNTAVVTVGTYAASGIPSIDLRSPNNRFKAVYQVDGNFVISDSSTDRVIRGIGIGSKTMNLQLDGNVVWRAENNTTIDNTTTSNNGPTYMRISDDGVVRVLRLLDDAELWNSDSNLISPAMLGTFDSNLSRFRDSLTSTSNIANIKNLYNALPERTKTALMLNTASNSLAFVDPNGTITTAQIQAMRVALTSYIEGQFAVIRNVRYPGFIDYYVYLNKLVSDSTEQNIPDKPSKPGGFTPDTNNLRNYIPPVASLPPIGSNPTAPGNGPGNQIPPGLGTPPPTAPLAPAITLLSTNATSKIETVTISHPVPTSEIKVTIGTGIPTTNYIKGSNINIPPGQQLRAIAIVDSQSSTITTRGNANPAPPPPPPPGGQGSSTGPGTGG